MSTTIYTAESVAAECGVSATTVRRHARQHKIGIRAQLGEGPHVYTAGEKNRLKKLIVEAEERGKFQSGNDLWQSRKSHGRKTNIG